MKRNCFHRVDSIDRNGRLWASASVTALGLLTLTACGKATTTTVPQNQMQNPTASAPDSPASKCSSSDAIATVKGIIVDQAKSQFSDDQSKSSLSDPGFLDRFNVENVLVQSVDTSVNKVTCQASLRFNVPEQYKKSFQGAISINNGFARNPGSLGTAAPDAIPDELIQDSGYTITYTAQPEAGKDDLYYSLNDVDPLAHAAGLLATTMEAPANSQAGQSPSGNDQAAPPGPPQTSVSASSAKSEYGAQYDACMSSGDAAQGIDSAMLACSDAELDRQNTRLNADYRRITSQANDSQQHRLQDSERTWIHYRDQHCQEGNNTGGTIDAENRSGCLMSETQKRIEYLEQPPGMILR